MPCPLPGNKAVLSEEAEFRDSERQKVIDRAAKLHLEGLSNAVIKRRLGITLPTLVAYLRAAGLSGASARPEPSLNGAKVLEALREREAYLDSRGVGESRPASLVSAWGATAPTPKATKRKAPPSVPVFPRSTVARIGSAD